MALEGLMPAATEVGKAVVEAGKTALEGLKDINPVSAIRQEFPSMFERPDNAVAKPSNLEGSKGGAKIEASSASHAENPSMFEKPEVSYAKEVTERPTVSGEVRKLNDVEKAKIKNDVGWSNDIVDEISNIKEYEIYKNANVHEEVCNGRKCLVKNDINPDYVDPKTGLTNRERMENGRAPIDEKTGEKISLHHLGQKFDAPFVELCENSEHGDGNHGILHTKTENSWRNDPKLEHQYQNEKQNHWKVRAKEL